MLQRNGSQYRTIGYATGGLSAWQNKFIVKEEELFLLALLSPYASYPQGYGMRAISLPIKTGGMSGRATVDLVTIANGSMGINIEGNSTISTTFANADGILVVSGSGTASFNVTAGASSIAVLYGIGSTSFSMSLNHLASFVDAYGWANCALGMAVSPTGTLTAIAIMEGDTIDDTVLTPQAIWAYKPDVATKSDVFNAAML
jgi:hypothetical protein